MARERAKASFDVEAMTHFFAGGREKHECMQKAFRIVQRDPELTVQEGNFFDLTRDEHREFTMRQIKRAVELRNSLNDPQLSEAIFRALVLYSESFGMRMYVHELLFKSAINLFGDDEQKQAWQEDIAKCRVLGCFAMTELGHSSALRGLETTATYDQDRDEFVIDSPSLLATKWWIGMAGHTATHCVAICQTIVKDKNHGINWFIVPLRDPKTGRNAPGVVAGDIGAKAGRAGLDNGWIQFNHVRIPRKNMLSKWISLDPKTAVFTPAPNPAIMYGTLIPERLSISEGTHLIVGQALTIATRYGVVRQQGSNDEHIMDYQTHYVKLMPSISALYVVRVVGWILDAHWQQMSHFAQNDQAKYLARLADMHSVAAGVKATVTWFGSEILERCRRACGGHAYSAYNAIPGLIGDWGVTTTGAGDNIVLLQQTGRYLLNAVKDVYAGAKTQEGSVAYFNDAQDILARSTCPFQDARDWAHLDAIIDVLRWGVINKLAGIAQALGAGETYNNYQLQTTLVAELHTYAHMFSLFNDAVKGNSILEIPEPLCATFKQTGVLYGLEILVTHLATFLEEGYLNGDQAKAIRTMHLEQCRVLRDQAIPLVDVWAFPDFILKAPIGRADGDIYPAYMNTLRSAPGCFGPPAYYEQLVRPLVDPDMNGKSKL
ncbi:hypothetical protein BZG36_02826 [Bifiguratus adelaidae]|uniref:Acyl-coenzyme A oxidase n=1 Tax=Bifiguratus adelaidae TaxID=1938954 RepID=A0A261Y0G9_9FUNG|nr:hypothetical protein BZG36_02826 [Bifiguratus adelaidae]